MKTSVAATESTGCQTLPDDHSGQAITQLSDIVGAGGSPNCRPNVAHWIFSLDLNSGDQGDRGDRFPGRALTLLNG